MHSLQDAISFGDLDDRSAGHDLQNGAVSLLDHLLLPEHERERHRSNGATLSHIKPTRAEIPARCLARVLPESDAPLSVNRLKRPCPRRWDTRGLERSGGLGGELADRG
jgi:hypothetical protein